MFDYYKLTMDIRLRKLNLLSKNTKKSKPNNAVLKIMNERNRN